MSCEWCGDTLDCDCESRMTCKDIGGPGHTYCGTNPCGCPRFTHSPENDCPKTGVQTPQRPTTTTGATSPGTEVPMDPKNENESPTCAILPLVTRSKSPVNWPVDVLKILKEMERAQAQVLRDGIGDPVTGRDIHGQFDQSKKIVQLYGELSDTLDQISIKIDEDSRLIEKLNTEREELVRKTETLGVIAKEKELVALLEEYGPSGVLRVAQLGIQWEDANQNERDMTTVLCCLADEGIDGYDLDDHLAARSPDELDKMKTCLTNICEELGKVNYED